MSPSEFCAFLQGFFTIAEAGRSERAKPLAFNSEQVAIIRGKLRDVFASQSAPVILSYPMAPRDDMQRHPLKVASQDDSNKPA